MERRHFLAGASASTILLASASSALAAARPGSADERLKVLLDKLFNSDVDNSPTTATQLALDKGARAGLRGRLDDSSKAGRARSDARDRAALASLRSFKAAGLSEQGKLQLATALYLNERAVVPQKFDLRSVQRPYVIAQNGGAYFSIPDFLGSVHPVESAADGKAYLSRLAAFATALDNDTALQASEAARGYLAPGWSLDLALGQMRKLRQPAAEANTLTRSLADRAKAKGIAGNWSADAAAIVEKSVYPALDRQITLVERLRKTTPAGDGFWRLPRGGEIYAEALASATTTNMTPDEVHAIGLEQVADLTARLEVILKGAGLTTGSVGDRLTALNARPEQVYPNTDAGRKELIDGLNAGVEAMWARLPQAFNDVPRKPLEIRRVPAEIQDGASNGYYYRAPMDGSRPAIYWINLKDTADWPKYQLPSLTYHEGLPGHHLQLSYVNAAGALPDYLRNVFISAYGEGWALYSEQLADELGAYSGIESAGYLQSFLFRAARLVVDTGLHHKRWSREKAADYLVATTGFARGRGLREVERYCTSGGQACSYKIGHNKWLELRARAQTALGDKFTLPWFHDVLREGIMPLSLLEQRVNERIAARLKA